MATIDAVEIPSLLFTEGSAPATPASGFGRLYVKTTGLYFKGDDGTEVGPLAAAGGAGSVGGPPVIVRKTADESVTSSTTLQADDALLFAVGASQVWAFEFRLIANGATAGDIKFGIQCPASASGKASFIGLESAVTTAAGDVRSNGVDLSSATPPASGASFGVGGTTDYGFIHAFGVITTAGTAGNCTLYWSQVSSSATATKILAGSVVVAHRLS